MSETTQQSDPDRPYGAWTAYDADGNPYSIQEQVQQNDTKYRGPLTPFGGGVYTREDMRHSGPQPPEEPSQEQNQ